MSIQINDGDLSDVFKHVYQNKTTPKRNFDYMENDPWAIDYALLNDASNIAIMALARSCIHLSERKRGFNLRLSWDGSEHNLFLAATMGKKSILQSSFFTNQNINQLIGLMSVNLNHSANLLPRVIGLLAIISFILSSKNHDEGSRDLELIINSSDYGINVTKTPHETMEFMGACNPDLCKTLAEFTSVLFRQVQSIGTPVDYSKTQFNQTQETFVQFDSEGKCHLVPSVITEFPKIPSSLFNKLLDQPEFFVVFSELMSRLTRATLANLFATSFEDQLFAGHNASMLSLIPYCRGTMMILSGAGAFGDQFNHPLKRIQSMEGYHVLQSFAGLRDMCNFFAEREPISLPNWLKLP